MRRSGSSSCLLRPKSDVILGNTTPAGGVVEPLSVTLVSTEQLFSYSCERFYLLSEISLKAHSTLFLCDFLLKKTDSKTDDETEEESTQEAITESAQHQKHANGDSPSSSSMPNSNTTSCRSNVTPEIPPFVILYLLWEPDMTTSAKEFTETTIVKNVERLERFVEFADDDNDNNNNLEQQQQQQQVIPSPSSSNEEKVSETTASTITAEHQDAAETRIEQHQEQEQKEADEEEKTTKNPQEEQSPPCTPPSNKRSTTTTTTTTSLYLIVDRIVPPRPSYVTDPRSRSHLHRVQADLAHDLAKQVACHAKLRRVCQGMTVGVSNHERAAPGLEACVTAVSAFSSDRRRNSSSFKSLMALVTEHPHSLVGINNTTFFIPQEQTDNDDTEQQQQTDDDTAQPQQQQQQQQQQAPVLLQTRICAEWNGQGNLQSFSRRAHATWRRQRGLPVLPPIIAKRKVKRSKKQRPPRHVQRVKVRVQTGSGAGADEDEDDAALDRVIEEFLLECFADLVIVVYVLFHYRQELQALWWLLLNSSSYLEEFAHYLRGL